MMQPFSDNLAALERRSPAAAARVREAPARTDLWSTATAADGLPVLIQGASSLDSRRDPLGAARRQAFDVPDGRIAVVGLGTGYFLEALLQAGRDVAALIESSPERVAAAMRTRDLRALLERVPVLFADDVDDPVELACLKASVAALAAHGASVATDVRLQNLLDAWRQAPIPRRPPRVMVVGPIYGGSLETARSTARAMRAVGAETRFLDFGPFAGGWEALSRLQVPAASRSLLQARYAEVAGDAVLREATAWCPDLVLALAQAPLSTAVLDQLRAGGTTTAFWFVENFRVLPYWQQVAHAYDVFFTIQREPFFGHLRRAGVRRAVYLPTACDRARHVPVRLTDEEKARFEADVSFAGAPYLNRRRLLVALTDFNLRLWGEGWDRTELAKHAAQDGQRFSLAEMVRVFSGTRVNLNIHSAAHVDTLDPDPDYLNPRTFELAACGAFQLVDEREPLRELFAADEVISFDSVRRLRDLAAYYLAAPEERSTIAARAQARALAEHTFEHRARTILRETLPVALVAAARLGLDRETLDAAIRREGRSARMTRVEAALRALKQLEVEA